MHEIYIKRNGAKPIWYASVPCKIVDETISRLRVAYESLGCCVRVTKRTCKITKTVTHIIHVD